MVLCYHAVSDTWDHPLAVRRETLTRQLAGAIRLGWKPTRAAELVAGRSRSLHVTFDDAYRSVRDALPILERLGIQATVFVCTDYAREGRALDLPPLDRVPAADREELATMSWDELRELAERGVEIGSHTRTHPNLREVSTDELAQEVTGLPRGDRKRTGPRLQVFRVSVRSVRHAGSATRSRLPATTPPWASQVSAGWGDASGSRRVEPGRDGALRMLLKSSPAGPPVARASRRMRSALSRLELRRPHA